jgi:hypothetical protein
MVPASPSEPLAQLEVLVVDCGSALDESRLASALWWV